MAANKKKSGKKGVATSRWHDGETAPEDLEPSELIAHEIVTAYADLTPSVGRIMDAELDAAQRLVAITSFRDSLSTIGDPNRDPRQAIANAIS
jgi:hypothetical protein